MTGWQAASVAHMENAPHRELASFLATIGDAASCSTVIEFSKPPTPMRSTLARWRHPHKAGKMWPRHCRSGPNFNGVCTGAQFWFTGSGGTGVFYVTVAVSGIQKGCSRAVCDSQSPLEYEHLMGM